MRVLALDLGARRIGLALSDAEGRIAFPEGSLERRGAWRDREALRRLVEERGVERIVVGLPIHMDGREGEQARTARTFAANLERDLGVPVEVLDERWTTREAERSLRATGHRVGGHDSRTKSRGKRLGRGAVDAVAASLLLSTYLERARACRDQPS